MAFSTRAAVTAALLVLLKNYNNNFKSEPEAKLLLKAKNMTICGKNTKKNIKEVPV